VRCETLTIPCIGKVTQEGGGDCQASPAEKLLGTCHWQFIGVRTGAPTQREGNDLKTRAFVVELMQVTVTVKTQSPLRFQLDRVPSNPQRTAMFCYADSNS
jgi:hypothetical protein